MAYSKNGYYFHVTVGSTSKITLQSSSAVSAFNSSSEFGFSNWELNTAKEHEKLLEFEDAANIYKKYAQGDVDADLKVISFAKTYEDI